MKRIRVLSVLFLLAAIVVLACDRGAYDVKFFQQVNQLVESTESHGHARVSLIDRQSFSLMRWLWFVNLSYYSDSSRLGQTVKSAEVAPPEALSAVEWKARDPFYDHPRDGAWSARSDLRTTNADGDLVTGGVPFVLLVNSAKKGRPYVSVVFQNVFECISAERSGWTAAYSDRLEPRPLSAAREWEADGFSSRIFRALIPGVAKMDFSYSLRRYSEDELRGSGVAFEPGESDPFLWTSDQYYRMGKAGVLGLWSSGLMARPYAGEFLPEMFHPVAISLVEKAAGPDMNLYVLLSRRESIEPEIKGKRLGFDYSTANGRVDGELELRGSKLSGSIFDPLSGETMDLTFVPAGTKGRKPKLKRVTPATVDLAAAGREARFTIVGKNFANGAMVFFDDDRVALRSVEFVSKKKIKVGVEALEPLAGTAIGVRVLNPDNRAADKARALRLR